MYSVKILKGTEDLLVAMRSVCNVYETNKEIRIWSAFFLLKALTTAPFISNWRRQRPLLLKWLQMDEKTFYGYMAMLKNKKLITVDNGFNIHPVSWDDAAKILGVPYLGTTTILFNPYKHEGKQVFQHLIRREEIKSNQIIQLEALMSKLDKNLPLKDDLLLLMIQLGADRKRLLTDKSYFQERLLQLDIRLFKEGSEIIGYSFTNRADINRGVKKIAEHHHYKSPQSVSYMKKVMVKHGIIQVKKIKVISDKRGRFYYRLGEKMVEGYKWFKDQKQTAWTLTDQITFNDEKKQQEKPLSLKKAA